MKKVCIILLSILLIWFSMDMTGFSIGDIIIVEAAWNSIDGVWWIIFLVLCFFFYIKDRLGKYILTVFVFLWTVIQFFSHWYYTLFGASDKKIISYNQFFKDTYHIIAASDTRVIPDFYHIVLHIFILVNLTCLVIFCIYNCNSMSKDIDELK
ncbi:hypothetical protein KHQ81_08660 [Mycoplasmatota bacterium]|nr:hypothetical protein KHQ81_08660 [Mycoplasmatota bacterium]